MAYPSRKRPGSWPSFRFEPDCCTHEEAPPRRVMVAVDATHKHGEDALDWALLHLVREGDQVIFLAVVHSVKNPLGYKMLANPSSFNGASGTIIQHEVQAKRIEYETKLQSHAKVCQDKKASLEIHVKAGYPLKLIVVMEALAMNVHSIVLDKRLRQNKDFYLKHLSCNVAILTRKGDGEPLLHHRNEDTQMIKVNENIAQESLRSLRKLMSLEETFTSPCNDDISFGTLSPHVRQDNVSNNLLTKLEKLNEKLLKSTCFQSIPQPSRTQENNPSSTMTSPSSELLMGGPCRWKPPIVPRSLSIDFTSSSSTSFAFSQTSSTSSPSVSSPYSPLMFSMPLVDVKSYATTTENCQSMPCIANTLS